ncbi:hypothetical protein N7486_008822 [Penicillium sp. IBT 16267x]|nr:hypothetical protein N7486_008822 [Penicillium sp. IBT 16267x]
MILNPDPNSHLASVPARHFQTNDKAYTHLKMFERMKAKLWSNPEKPSKDESKQTANEKPSKSEEKAQERFSREHSKRVRAREKALVKAQEERAGGQTFEMRGSFLTICGGGC